MSYELRFSGTFEEDLRRLPVWLRRPVLDHARQLAEQPAAMSKRVVSPPYPPGGMMSTFSIPSGDILHHVVLFFKYTTDERAISVYAIGHTALLNDHGRG